MKVPFTLRLQCVPIRLYHDAPLVKLEGIKKVWIEVRDAEYSLQVITTPDSHCCCWPPARKLVNFSRQQLSKLFGSRDPPWSTAPATGDPLTNDDTSASAYESSPPYFAAPRHSNWTATMLLLDYQNVLIESLLKDRFSGCALPRRCPHSNPPD